MRKSKIFLAILILCLTLSIFYLHSNSTISNNLEPDRDNPTKTLKASAVNGGGYIMNTNADYSWIEISSIGTNMTQISDEDDEYQEIDMFGLDGWNFTFYETNYSKIYVSSNGWMSFPNQGYTDDWVYEIPDQNLENFDCISLLCEDLNLDDLDFGGGDIFYRFFGIEPDRYLVIEYYQVYDFFNGELVGDFEVILYENGTIKFQYKTVNVLYRFEPFIGLDHGDMTNYNSYDANLPLSTKAITFVFDKLLDVNYTLTINKGDQFTWKITQINHTRMESVFGSNWEQMFGLYPEMNVNDKTKINISLINENGTHWDIKYDMWDWINEGNNFGATPDVDPVLTFRKEPLNYTQKHNLTNLVPFILPKFWGCT